MGSLASEGFPLQRAEEILQEEWDRRVHLATSDADRDQSPAVRRALAALTGSGVLALENAGFDNRGGHDLATVVAALEAEGLPVTWNGSAETTITLEDLHWLPMPGTGPRH